MTIRIRIRPAIRFALCFAAVLTSGCVSRSIQHMPEFKRDGAELRVLMMPLDVQLAELTAGGTVEPRADWTAQAEKLIRTDIEATLAGKKAIPVSYVRPDADTTRAHLYDQIVKLHARIGNTASLHHYFLPLPNKKGAFDWSLGPDTKALHDEFKTDYALFVHVRDSYASDGRVAAIILANLIGVPLQGGRQTGFASLVDLKTGEIVWFNLLLRGHGDLRTDEAAKESVSKLLDNFPK